VQGYELVMLNGVAVALYGETDFLQARCAENAGCCRELSRASRNNARNVPVFDVFRAFGDEFGGLSGAIGRFSHPHPAMPPKCRTPKQDLYACGTLPYDLLMRCLPDPEEYEAVEAIHSGLDGVDGLIRRAIAPERQRLGTTDELRHHFWDVIGRQPL